MFCGLVLLAAPAAQAAPIVYTAMLSGAAEAPSNDSPGTGSATVTYDDMLHTLRVQVTFSDLSAPTIASHIHCCVTTPGGTAGVATQVPFFAGFPIGVTGGTYDNTFDLTMDSSWNPSFIAAHGGTAAGAEAFFAAGLGAGTAYLNIHTSAFPSGEIRGFLQPVPEPGTYALMLGGLSFLGWVARRRRAGSTV
jgi:hypothetical protein